MSAFKFKVGDIAVFKGCTGSPSTYTSSGNSAFKIGQKLKIVSAFVQTGYTGAPNAYYVAYLENNINGGWMLESELCEDEYTFDSLKEKIKNLYKEKEDIEDQINNLNDVVTVLKDNNLEKISAQELKILRVLRIVDTTYSTVEKMKAISEILK